MSKCKRESLCLDLRDWNTVFHCVNTFAFMMQSGSPFPLPVPACGSDDLKRLANVLYDLIVEVQHERDTDRDSFLEV